MNDFTPRTITVATAAATMGPPRLTLVGAGLAAASVSSVQLVRGSSNCSTAGVGNNGTVVDAMIVSVNGTTHAEMVVQPQLSLEGGSYAVCVQYAAMAAASAAAGEVAEYSFVGSGALLDVGALHASSVWCRISCCVWLYVRVFIACVCLCL